MIRYRYLLLILLCGLAGCNEFQQAVDDASKEKPLPPKDNYIILLDLSDRILTNNQQQVPKDIFVVESIYKAFRTRIDAKDPTRLYYTVNDKLKVLVAPQKTTRKDVFEMTGNLRVNLSGVPQEQKATLLDETGKKIQQWLPQIYKSAVISNNSTDYAGADIWRYFNEDLQGDLEKDATNTLFIISDGYMNFENTDGRPSKNNRFTSCSQIISNLKKSADWNSQFKDGDYGLLPVNKKFPGLKVVMLEIDPKDDWAGEYSLLTAIWGKWFNEMGISSYSFVKDDNVQEINESIEKLLQVRITGDKQPLPWKPVREIDSVLAMAVYNDTLAVKKKDLAASKAAHAPDIHKKTRQKNPPVKPSHNSEQVTFGPAY